MLKAESRFNALRFSDIDLRVPLSTPPPIRPNFKFLNPLKWLVIIVLAGIFTGGVGTLFWYAYLQGYDQASAEHAPEIFPDTSPFKERPLDPGGLHVPHQNRQVYEVMKGGIPPDRTENLMPLPEAPILRELPEEPAEIETFQEVLPVEEIKPQEEKPLIKKNDLEKPQIDKKHRAVEQPESVQKKQEEKESTLKKDLPPAMPTAKVMSKVRLGFGSLPTRDAAERELARLKYNNRMQLGGINLSIQTTPQNAYRIQSQQLNQDQAEKIQKALKGQKITAIVLK